MARFTFSDSKYAVEMVMGEEMVFTRYLPDHYVFVPCRGYERGVVIVVDPEKGCATIKSPLGFEADRDITREFRKEYKDREEMYLDPEMDRCYGFGPC